MQYNKVEICGINTADLKVLDDNKQKELMHVVKNGTPEQSKNAREILIKGNLRLVLSVVQKFTNRGENPDDLFQVGCIGLIKAIDNFDDTLDVKFSTYGVPMIIGEVRRYLRDSNYIRVSRSIRDTAYKAMQAKEKLQNELLREPTIEEIADEISQTRENVIIALEAIVEPVSLYEPVFSDGGDTVYVMDQISDSTGESGWIDELSIKDSIQKLSDRERKILSLRFYSGKTQTETAKCMGISQAQVSRIEKCAINKIRPYT